MTSAANIFVAIRVRPQNDSEVQSQKRNVVEVIDDSMLVFDPAEEQNFAIPSKRKYDVLMHKNKDIKFAFDRVFGPECANSDVFEQTSKPLITRLLDGYNCSVFAYGATGAGKTFTMLGTSSHRGIMYHTMVELFEQIENIRDEKAVEVSVSYLEIYNEQIKDLLNPGHTLPIREGPDSVAYVTDLSIQKPRNAEEVFALLEFGNANRTQHPTDANAESSRSHALFQVYVRQKDKAGGTVVGCHVAKLSLIDLAGSERAIVTSNRGARFREGANINRSLLALGNCINALAEGKAKFVNYRDSKLTRLLKDSLGGNCYTVMIAAVSPSALWFDDTHNTLQYANRAKNIKVDVTQNVVNVDARLGDYRRIISEQRDEIARLREEVAKLRGGTMALTKQGANEAAHALQTFEIVPDRCRAEARRVTDRLLDLYSQLTKAQQERDRLTALRLDRMRQAQNLMLLAGSTSTDDHSVPPELAEERKQARESSSSSHKASQALLNKLEPVNRKVEELTKAIESAHQSAVERTRLPESLLSSQTLVTPQLTACRNLARQAWDFSRELCQTKVHAAKLECEVRCLKTETGMLKKRMADSDGFIRCILESVARQRSSFLTGQARSILLKPASFSAPASETQSLPSSSFWLSSEPKNENISDENVLTLPQTSSYADDSPRVEPNQTITVTSKKGSMNRSSSCSGLQQQQQIQSLTRSAAAMAISSSSRAVVQGPRTVSKQPLAPRQLTSRGVGEGAHRSRLNRATASASTLPSPFKRSRSQFNAADVRLGLYSIAESRNSNGAVAELPGIAEAASPCVDWPADNFPRVRKTPVRYDSSSMSQASRFAKPSTPQSPSKRPKMTKTFRERIFDRFK